VFAEVAAVAHYHVGRDVGGELTRLGAVTAETAVEIFALVAIRVHYYITQIQYPRYLATQILTLLAKPY